MKHKKILIISIIIVAVLVIAAGGFVFAYMTTDILKTDEQLFYKYISTFGKDISNLGSKNFVSYSDKLETTPYESKGVLTVDVTTPEDIGEEMNFDIVNDMNITFEGKTDKANNLSEQTININYSDDVTFPILYKHTGNIYGMTSEKIINGSGIIAVKNENLSEFFEKLGINLEITNEIKLDELNLAMEKLVDEFPKLQQIIINNLTNENFSKVDENDFVLTLTEKQFMTIVLQMVEEIKQSGILPAKIIEAINEEEENIQEQQFSDEEFFKLVVNKNKKVIISVEEEIIATITSTNGIITIQLTDEEDAPIMTLQKSENENNLSYQVKYIQTGIEVSFVINYTDLQTQTVNENYLLTLSITDSESGETSDEQSEKVEYQYNFDTSKTFVNAVEIEELNSDNAFIINEKIDEYGVESIKALLQQIGTAIVNVNNEQMQQLGVNTHPLILATPLATLYYNISSNANNAVNNSSTQMEDVAKQSFNSAFINYEGIQKGSNAKALIDRVVASNQTDSNHIVSVNGYTDESSLQNFKSQLNVSATYNIQFNYDAQGENAGYITSITITAQ